MQVTESDLAVLRRLHELTRSQGGQPPTLAELAQALGLQASSRGNVQRQLSRLRPTYVDWTSSPRSLHLTPVGLALLGVGTGEEQVLEPLPDPVLPLLARGLTELSERIKEGRSLETPYPRAWSRGVSMLAASCLMHSIDPPLHLGEVIRDWCMRPPVSWPISPEMQPRLYDAPLYEDGEPTTLCRELANSISQGDAEQELSEQLMGRILQQAQNARKQEAYVAVRQHVIEHAVISEEKLIMAGFSPEMSIFSGELHDLYEPVPTYITEQRQVFLCGHCGWTLERRNGRLSCGSEQCRVLTEGFTLRTRVLELNEEMRLMRVRRAIRRYIVAPGVYEISTMRRVRALGLRCDLWPGYDAYDLRIIFPSGAVWAVDIKDWQYPHLLGRRLTAIPQTDDLRWTSAFYAVPDARVQATPSYLSLLGIPPKAPFRVVTISELLHLIEEAYA